MTVQPVGSVARSRVIMWRRMASEIAAGKSEIAAGKSEIAAGKQVDDQPDAERRAEEPEGKDACSPCAALLGIRQVAVLVTQFIIVIKNAHGSYSLSLLLTWRLSTRRLLTLTRYTWKGCSEWHSATL